MTDHTKEMFYFDASECDHIEPEDDMSDEWHDWSEIHTPYDDGWLCREKPAGFHCVECSEEHGEVFWEQCRARPHARLAGAGRYPRIEENSEHKEVEVFVGLYECLDGDCDEYEEGDEVPEKCSHITVEKACMCQLDRMSGEVVRECPKAA